MPRATIITRDSALCWQGRWCHTPQKDDPPQAGQSQPWAAPIGRLSMAPAAPALRLPGFLSPSPRPALLNPHTHAVAAHAQCGGGREGTASCQELWPSATAPAPFVCGGQTSALSSAPKLWLCQHGCGERGVGVTGQQEAGPATRTPQTNSLRRRLSSECESRCLDANVCPPGAGGQLQQPQQPVPPCHKCGTQAAQGLYSCRVGRQTQLSPGHKAWAPGTPDGAAQPEQPRQVLSQSLPHVGGSAGTRASRPLGSQLEVRASRNRDGRSPSSHGRGRSLLPSPQDPWGRQEATA